MHSASDIRKGGESGIRMCKPLQKVGQNESKVFMGSLWLCKQMIVKVTRYLICFNDNLLVFIFGIVPNYAICSFPLCCNEKGSLR